MMAWGQRAHQHPCRWIAGSLAVACLTVPSWPGGWPHGMAMAHTPAAAERAIDATAMTSPAEADDMGLNAKFSAFLADVRAEALASGVSAATFKRATVGLAIDPSIESLLTAQPEHSLAPWDYAGRLVSETRIAEGREKLAEHARLLAEIEAGTGIDGAIVTAIWGVESSYGRLPGTRSVVRSLATLSVADRRRPAFWRSELLAALTILQRGDIDADRMTGSWAGAMGHTQFMPSSYLAHAVDHDGDGRRDIWSSVPDALASTARYLVAAGWRAGEPWGLEVLLPAGFDYGLATPDARKATADWQALGVTPPWGAQWPEALPATWLMLPAGRHGPAFLIAPNFEAILKYNNSTAYAMAVGHLADRLRGGPGLAALWPTDDPPLAVSERRELQKLLTGFGFSVGAIDGIIGEGTRRAVRAWQSQQGEPADGWTGARLLDRLRMARGDAGGGGGGGSDDGDE